MFGSKEKKDKSGNFNRMTPAQRAKMDAYYEPIEAELKALDLKGKALTEWKYQRYMRDYLSTAASLDRNIGRTLNYRLKVHTLWVRTRFVVDGRKPPGL